MKIWKKLGFCCLALLMICSTAVLAVGCGERDWNKIELNEVTHSIFYAPLYVAMDNGYFKDEGLTVTLTNGGGSNVSMNALLSGSADIILAGPETSVYTQHVADAPKVFGQLTTCDGSFIVSKTPMPNFTLDDLKGKSIIGGRPGGMPAMILNYILDREGLDIGDGADKVKVRSDVDFNNTASVWASDDTIDFCALFEPVATNMTKQNSSYSIVASLGELLHDTVPYTCFAAREGYLKEHGDVAEKFISAILRATKFIKDNTDATVAKSLEDSFVGTTLSELEASVKNYRAISAWSEDMILTQEAFNKLVDVLEFNNTIATRPNWANIVDNTIAEKLKAERI